MGHTGPHLEDDANRQKKLKGATLPENNNVILAKGDLNTIAGRFAGGGLSQLKKGMPCW